MISISMKRAVRHCFRLSAFLHLSDLSSGASAIQPQTATDQSNENLVYNVLGQQPVTGQQIDLRSIVANDSLRIRTNSSSPAFQPGPAKDEDVLVSGFEPLIKYPVVDGKVNVYQSTKSGSRFVFKQHEFNEPHSSRGLFGDTRATLKINLDNVKQRIDGFGGAFTDAACENLMGLPENVRQNIVDDYFDPKTGLEYTLGRTTIGGSDFSSRVYTLDDYENDYELKRFALTDEDTKWKIPIIKMAMKHVPDIKIIATSWSPPVWLKTNHRINHRGSIVGEVTDKAYVTYANYYVKFLDAYKNAGINIYGISPANEPTNGRLIPFFPFNCVGFSERQMADYIALTLGPTLKNNGYGKDKLKLFIVDDQRYHLRSWVNTIMETKNISQYVTGIGFHWYGNGVSSSKVLDEMKSKHPELDLWATEACSGSYSLIHKHVEIGSWSRAEAYAKDISEDFNHQTSAWLDWNIALNMQGGPNWSGNYVDAPIIIDHSENRYIRQPMFYALAHFTKFIKPGSLNLAQDLKIENKLFPSGFYTTSHRTADGQVVVVVSNTYSRDDVKLSIQVKSGNSTRQINQTVPKRSITTFVWKA